MHCSSEKNQHDHIVAVHFNAHKEEKVTLEVHCAADKYFYAIIKVNIKINLPSFRPSYAKCLQPV